MNTTLHIQLEKAFKAHSNGDLDSAKLYYKKVLGIDPYCVPALGWLGTIEAQSKNYLIARPLLEKALASGNDPDFLLNYANLLQETHHYEQAVEIYLKVVDIRCTQVVLLNLAACHNELKQPEKGLQFSDQALTIDPNYAEAWSNRGNSLNDLKRHKEALASFDKSLALKPYYAEVWSNRGVALNHLKRHEDALDSYHRCLELLPDYAEAWSNRAVALNDLKRHEEALECCDRAIELNPNYAEAWNNRSVALNDLKRHEKALVSCDRCLELKPAFAEAWTNRGIALNYLKRHEDALASLDKSLTLKPHYGEAWNNRGLALSALMRYENALESYDRCLAINPEYAIAWNNRGLALSALMRYERALESYDRCIQIKPDYANAWCNRGVALSDLKRLEEALESYKRSMELKPDGEFWLGNLVHTQMSICDWTDLEQRRQAIAEKFLDWSKVSTPFTALGLFDNPLILKLCSEIYAKDKLGHCDQLGPFADKARRGRIRVGYFSADFHNHATMILMAGLFEQHDKSKFDVYGFSFGPNCNDSMRQRAIIAFDHFIDVTQLSDSEVAALSREYGIDIAIELKGYTQDSRPQIFAARAAPIQISYLGYPGTMGSESLDYLIADPTLIPEDAHDSYSEKIIYLPNSYQVNDSNREIPDQIFTRNEVGLPVNGFVFCCFNNNWKILPEVFNCWMSILQSVGSSVLWLLEDNPAAAKNLRKEASKRGIDPNRLIFAKRMPYKEHLARYKLANLFLDTTPYNSHTTASDALWAGVPLLTLQGQSFAARVAASLLTNIGASELITHTREEYRSLAIELALNPEKLKKIRAKLAHNRLTTPLFDTKLFTKHIEIAYQTAYDRYHTGLPPDHIYVNN